MKIKRLQKDLYTITIRFFQSLLKTKVLSVAGNRALAKNKADANHL